MKRSLAVLVATMAALLISAAVALAWIHPTPGTITCDAATFNVPAGAHETTPWYANEFLNGAHVVTDAKVYDTATRSAAGTITVPLALTRDGLPKHVKVTVNGPGGYSDGGATVEADVTCGVRPPAPVPPAEPTPPVAAPPAAAPPVVTPATPVALALKPRPVVRHRCRKGYHRVQKRYKRGHRKGQRFTLCVRDAPPRVITPHFAG